jgi:hypothetical protein
MIQAAFIEVLHSAKLNPAATILAQVLVNEARDAIVTFFISNTL